MSANRKEFIWAQTTDFSGVPITVDRVRGNGQIGYEVLSMPLDPSLGQRRVYAYAYIVVSNIGGGIPNNSFQFCYFDLIFYLGGEQVHKIPFHFVYPKTGTYTQITDPPPEDRPTLANIGDGVSEALFFQPVSPVKNTATGVQNSPEPATSVLQPIRADFTADRLSMKIADINLTFGFGGRVLIASHAW